MLISRYLVRLDRQQLSFVLWHNSAIVCGEQIWAFHLGSNFNGQIKIGNGRNLSSQSKLKVWNMFLLLCVFLIVAIFIFVSKWVIAEAHFPNVCRYKILPKGLPIQLDCPKLSLSEDFICDRDLLHCFVLFLCECFAHSESHLLRINSHTENKIGMC